MRKTRLVIQPRRCLHSIGFLLLFMSCPVLGDWGLVQPDASQRAMASEQQGSRILLKHPPESRVDSRRVDDSRFGEKLYRREERRTEPNLHVRRERMEDTRRVENRRLLRGTEANRVSEMRVVAPRKMPDTSRRLLRENQTRRETAAASERRVAENRNQRLDSRVIRNSERLGDERRNSRSLERKENRDDQHRSVSERSIRSMETDRRISSRDTRSTERRIEHSRRLTRSAERTAERREMRLTRSAERKDDQRDNERAERRETRLETTREATRAERRDTTRANRRETAPADRRETTRADRRDTRIEVNRANPKSDNSRNDRVNFNRQTREKRDTERQIRSVSVIRAEDLRQALEKDNLKKTSVIAQIGERRNIGIEKRMSQTRFETTFAKTNSGWDTYKGIISHCILGAAVYFTARKQKSIY